MTELEPTHAFVVMAHDDSPFLGGCLASLRGQTTTANILLTTSTPSPFIEATAAAFEVPVLVNPRRDGIAADWNFALNATQARHVTLAHQDDVYAPAFLERTLALLGESPDAVLCFTGYQEITEDGSKTSSKVSKVTHLLEAATLWAETTVGPGRMRAFLSLADPVPCSSVTFDRARLTGFAFDDAYRCNLDWDAWLRLVQAGKVFVRAPERLVGRRHNALTATTRLKREGVRQSEDLRMFRRLWPSPLAEIIAWVYRAGY